MANTRQSVVFSTLVSFISLAISAGLLVIVTRWLDAAEIGAFAVAYAVILILEIPRQFKIVPYVLQAEKIDAADMRAVQFVGLTVAGVLFVIALLAGLIMRESYDTPTTGNLLLMMSVTLLVRAIAQPGRATLSRDLRFSLVAGLKLLGAILKAALTIGFLLMGYREEALAIGIVAEAVVELAVLFWVKRANGLPLPSRVGTRPIWTFCGKFSGAQLLNSSASSGADLLIGSFLGLAAAGFFNRANVLVRTLRSGIEQAIFPIALANFAKSSRTEQADVKSAYLRALGLLTGASWPVLAVFIVLAEPLILTAYGQDWSEIINLSRILALSGIIFAATALSQAALAAVGAVDAIVKRELMIQGPRLTILFVTAQISIEAVGWGACLSMVIAMFVNEHLVGQKLSMSFTDLFAALWPSAVVALASALPTLLAVHLLSQQVPTNGGQLLIGSAVAAVFWLVSVLIFHKTLKSEILVFLAASSKLARR